MWFRTILRRKQSSDTALFDAAFLRRLEQLSLQASRSLRGQPAGGEHISRFQMPSGTFSEHRRYVSGDDLRYVDWNAYARQEQMHVKLGEIEQSIDIHLLLDASRSMGWGQPDKLRAARRLLGAIGYLALAHSDRVRLVAFGAQLGRSFGPARGKPRVPALLEALSAVQTEPATNLSACVSSYARQHPNGGLLVLLSDLLAAGGLEDALRMLPPPRWQVLVLHLLDPAELKPQLSGPLELQDAETGKQIELTVDQDLLSAYRRGVTRWQELLRDTCARRGATYAQILSDWPVERQVIPYLRKRRVFV